MHFSNSIESKKGAVALFDILGYQDLLINNRIGRAVSIIKNNFLALTDDLPQKLRYALDFDAETLNNKHIENLKWLIFSDSILLTLEIPASDLPFSEVLPNRSRARKVLSTFFTGVQWIVFLNACAVLARQMFKNGLPLRGSIHYGQYYVDEKCFAGEPIVSAYRDAMRQDWSGCIVSKEVAAIYKEILEFTSADKPSARWVLVDYEVPLKKSQAEKRSVINWVWLRGNPMVRKVTGDLPSFVHRSFSAYQKRVDSTVHTKIQHTEMFVKHVNSGQAFNA
jgi:hypothetical protein